MDYMPEEYWDQDDQDSCTSKTRLECTKILWPSLESMQDLYFQLRLQSQRDPSLGEEQPTVFLSPRTFALMEPDIHCQMFHYHAQPFPSCQKVPHNKTYFRLRSANGHEKRASDSIRYQCSCHSVIWFLMTSACLSKGQVFLFQISHHCASPLVRCSRRVPFAKFLWLLWKYSPSLPDLALKTLTPFSGIR
jgi:hypothetical protein